MLNCKDVTRLISESFDRRLTLRERFGLRIHVMMCRTCRLFRRLQHDIQDAVTRFGRLSQESNHVDGKPLPDDAKERMKSVIASGDIGAD